MDVSLSLSEDSVSPEGVNSPFFMSEKNLL